MKNTFSVVSVVLMGLLLLTLIAFGYSSDYFNKFKAEAIELGYAHYNGTNAQWEWIKPSGK